MRQGVGFEATKARDELAAYLDDHPEIRAEADVMVSNAIAAEMQKINTERYGPPPGA
ncbi:hypothetical protein ACH4XT_20530 [Streptomyces avidinii]|uniref:hypothetical protein n=1 Tax=Streptomyces avidinii TaxID=1895 RepID=UPI003797607E